MKMYPGTATAAGTGIVGANPFCTGSAAASNDVLLAAAGVAGAADALLRWLCRSGRLALQVLLQAGPLVLLMLLMHGAAGAGVVHTA